jgi:hypothetical protein
MVILADPNIVGAHWYVGGNNAKASVAERIIQLAASAFGQFGIHH